MDPKAELSEKDLQKKEKREAEQEKKDKKLQLEEEKRARKFPDKAPKVHKPKEVVLPKIYWTPVFTRHRIANAKWPRCF